ncbi:MAG: hypothetical protein KC777_26615 [Cyanobacteria bacterium HKST-UBA02]|nr:hypothetical protein [Cyanobacteria bacterium HKST-UBA02]
MRFQLQIVSQSVQFNLQPKREKSRLIMSQSTICVIRNVAGIDQYVPINTVPCLQAGERAFAGRFTMETAKDGPSRSHTRQIALPEGSLREVKVGQCVFREIDGQMEYVPVEEVPALSKGERLFTGIFNRDTVNTGPSRSHRRTVCTPVHVTEGKVTLN